MREDSTQQRSAIFWHFILRLYALAHGIRRILSGGTSPPPTRNVPCALLEPALVWLAWKFREKA
jgi:hypothetical protein